MLNDHSEFLLKLILRPLAACLCGGILGWNRERQGRAAGLRTQVLVCLGACIFTMAALELQQSVQKQYPDSEPDPIRVISGIVGGIGFLGAGSIIQSGSNVKGVTTAATVWVVGAIGIACGAGLFPLALTAVFYATISLVGLGRLERLMETKDQTL